MLNTNKNYIRNDLPFLPEKMKIGKFEKLTYNLNDKEEYVVHYKSFKTSTKSWISIQKMMLVIRLHNKILHISSVYSYE